MKYKRKSEPVVLRRNTESEAVALRTLIKSAEASLTKSVEAAIRRYLQTAVLGSDADSVAFGSDADPVAFGSDADPVAFGRNTGVVVFSKNTEAAGFIPAVFDGITSVGLLYPAMIAPIKYAGGHSTDMEMVGRDMWLAVKAVREDTYGTQKKSAAASAK